MMHEERTGRSPLRLLRYTAYAIIPPLEVAGHERHNDAGNSISKHERMVVNRENRSSIILRVRYKTSLWNANKNFVQHLVLHGACSVHLLGLRGVPHTK